METIKDLENHLTILSLNCKEMTQADIHYYIQKFNIPNIERNSFPVYAKHEDAKIAKEAWQTTFVTFCRNSRGSLCYGYTNVMR